VYSVPSVVREINEESNHEEHEGHEGKGWSVVIGLLEKVDAAQRPGAQDTAKSNDNSPEKNAMGGYRNSHQLTMNNPP